MVTVPEGFETQDEEEDDATTRVPNYCSNHRIDDLPEIADCMLSLGLETCVILLQDQKFSRLYGYMERAWLLKIEDGRRRKRMQAGEQVDDHLHSPPRV
ncbi:hypothetical protein ACE6H2_026759 [Prunus campanulata]